MLSRTVKYILLFIAIFAVLLIVANKNFNTSNPNQTHDLTYKGAVLAHIHRIGNGYGSKPSQEMPRHLSTI